MNAIPCNYQQIREPLRITKFNFRENSQVFYHAPLVALFVYFEKALSEKLQSWLEQETHC